MDAIDNSLPNLSKLIEQRLALLRILAESLESSSLALAQNDAEAIARGAAHQAELCRQWGRLEDSLKDRIKDSLKDRIEGRRPVNDQPCREARRSAPPSAGPSGESPEAGHSVRLQAEWEALGARIRYLTRVHWSLLRHLQRSLAVMNRVVSSCALTYTPDPALLRTEFRTEIRTELRLGSAKYAGE
jgi:hypothetical protein